MKALAVVPARYGSSRFPGKPLVDVGGEPLVVRVARRVEQAMGPDGVLVATDDERIADALKQHDVPYTMTPGGCATGTDRVYAATKDLDLDVVVNVQGDEPFVRPEDIQAVLQAHQDHPEAVVNARCAIDDDQDFHSRHVPKVVTDESGRLVYMSRAPVPYLRVEGRPMGYRQVCIYAFTPEQLEAYAGRERSLLEQGEDVEILRFLDLGYPVQIVEVEPVGAAIDTPEDLERVHAMLS